MGEAFTLAIVLGLAANVAAAVWGYSSIACMGAGIVGVAACCGLLSLCRRDD